MGNEAGAGGSTGRNRGAGAPPARYPWFLSFASALLKTMAFMATAALIAAAVSYYTVPQQVSGELGLLRAEWAEFRADVERRIEELESGAGSPGGPEKRPPESGQEERPRVSAGATGQTGEGSVPPSGAGSEVIAQLRTLLGLLAGQDRLAWALAEAVRQDWGSAADSTGLAAKGWENLGFAGLAGQARACQAELARGDPQGVARLRLLWSESQRAIAALIAELTPGAAPAAQPPP